MTVTAQDGGTPARFATITVDVNVVRETGALRFTLDTYSATIPETERVNSSIVQTFANPGVCLPIN
ncbi:hypothetical protein DPMN_036524 [Dreissena polymorpha]|uniref:Uncharacterized protein n=1 Tax=Dreissena polymorpha TaxID=45954 RepID=A0A9D4M9A5_DREPO|nr:hypothetical protein DPMN_036524 [Dreissena polymorpha]